MSIVDDWGMDDIDRDPMYIEQLSPSEMSHLAFLFGGVGDGETPSQGRWWTLE